MENRVYYGEYTLEHWIKLILRGNIVLPKYQRYFVWDSKKVETLIETLKKKEYVPSVTIGTITENDHDNRNYILDGQQRLTSILLAYFAVFPNKEKFKEQDSIDYANENDDSNENDERMEWTFEKIVNLNKEEREKIKEQSDFYRPLNITIDENFWSKTFLGFAYIVPYVQDKDKQQKFYSSVFRNINIQGRTLSTQESRRSLYFLKDGFDNFFETNVVRDLKVMQPTQPKDVDFIKYLSLLSQYKKDGKVDRLAYGYSDSRGKSLENYYEEYIYSIVNEKATDLFEKFTSIFPDGNYQNHFDRLKETIDSLFDTKEFSSIIDLDIHLFGLVYKIVFENKSIDKSKKTELLLDLKGVIESLKKSDSHKKSPGNLKYLKERINDSIEVYNKYEAQQPQ